jgi:hypothetical protein
MRSSSPPASLVTRKRKLDVILPVVTLLVLAVTQLLVFREGGWNPGLIAGAGLMTAVLLRNLRRPE